MNSHTTVNPHITTQLIEHTSSHSPHAHELSLDTTIWAVFNCILFVCILAGNTLTIIAVRTCRRLRATISNLFIVSLAVSDLIVGLSVPYHMAFYVGPELDHYRNLCLMRFFLIIFACSVSSFTLISIGIDRYIAIVYSLHYRRYMTRRVAYIKIFFNWSAGAGVAVIMLFWNNWNTASQCEFDEILPAWYLAGILTPGYLIIWVLMSVMYWRIVREASKQSQQLRNSISSQKSTTANSDWKSVQIVVFIMGTFSICWLPYFIVALGQMFQLFKPTSALYKGTLSLVMMNSCLNPIIYAWKNSNFRRAFLKLLRCKSPNSCPRQLIISQCSLRSRTSRTPPRRHSVIGEQRSDVHGMEVDGSAAKTTPTLQSNKPVVGALPEICARYHVAVLSDSSSSDSSSASGHECSSCLMRRPPVQCRKYQTIHKAIEDEMKKYERVAQRDTAMNVEDSSLH